MPADPHIPFAVVTGIIGGMGAIILALIVYIWRTHTGAMVEALGTLAAGLQDMRTKVAHLHTCIEDRMSGLTAEVADHRAEVAERLGRLEQQHLMTLRLFDVTGETQHVMHAENQRKADAIIVRLDRLREATGEGTASHDAC